MVKRVDDELSSAARVAITVATQMADRLARAREEAARTAQGRSEHEVKQLQERFSAERDAAVAKVSVVERPEFWERSSLMEQASMHETAQQWKDVDPRAQAASETIGRELRERYGIDVTNPQANPDAVRAALILRERAEAEAMQAAATAEKSGRGEAAVETALAGAALDEAARLDARAASERNDGQATAAAEPNADVDTSRTDRAAELELQAREYDSQANAGGTPDRTPDELRELAEDARAQAQLHREPAEVGAAQQASQAGAETNAASDQGRANAERSTGEAHYDSAELSHGDGRGARSPGRTEGDRRRPHARRGLAGSARVRGTRPGAAGERAPDQARPRREPCHRAHPAGPLGEDRRGKAESSMNLIVAGVMT